MKYCVDFHKLHGHGDKDKPVYQLSADEGNWRREK